MAKHELNADVWFYKRHLYRRGDVVDVEETDFVKGIVASGGLVPVGTNAKIAEEQEALASAQAERDAEAVRVADEEAAVRAAHDERRPYNVAGSRGQHRTVPNVSSQDGPQVTKPSGRPGNRRR